MDFKPFCRYCEQLGQKYRITTPIGWKQHMSSVHRGYTQEEAREVGVEHAPGDVIKGMSGFRSLEEVRAAAPDTEGASDPRGQGQGASTQVRRPRLSKDDQAKLELQNEFDRLRPMLVGKWERRLRIPYSLWARLANDPKISLTDKEATEGAEMHVELMQAMGWLRAGKVEAIADLVLWHGATILGRSDLGAQLLASISGPQPEQEEKKRPN